MDNQGATKAIPRAQERTKPDQGCRDSYANVVDKKLSMHWVPGQRTLKQAVSYMDFCDIRGENASDWVVNMEGDLR